MKEGRKKLSLIVVIQQFNIDSKCVSAQQQNEEEEIGKVFDKKSNFIVP